MDNTKMKSKAHILVVEDENIIALHLQKRLQNMGYVVPFIFASGEEAIQNVKEAQPDLILMDIQLKGKMSGIEAAQEIRTRFDIPVVYLTAYSEEATFEEAKKTEPFGYLLKPFEEKELKITIEMALYKHEIDKKLRENEQWLETTLKSIGDAVIATDRRGRVTFMNVVAETLTGWKKKEALGQKLTTVFNIINEKTRKRAKNPVEKACREGVIAGLANHTLLISKSGKEIPIDDSAAAMRDERGNIIGVVLVFRDITERKKAEEELRKSEERYRDLYEEAPATYLAVGVDRRIKRANKQAVELTGYDVASLIGKNIFNLYADTPRGKEKAKKIFKLFLAGKDIRNEEVQMQKADGSLTWVNLTVRPVRDEKGRIVETRSMVVDISERKRAEELMGLSKHMVVAEEAERRRVARDLHDGVNQILSSVAFRLHSIEAKIQGKDISLEQELEKTKKLLEKAMKEVSTISHNLRPSELDDLGLIAALRSNCEQFSERTGIELDFDHSGCPEHLPSETEVTFYRIVQEAFNNVEKHSEASQVHIRLTKKDGAVELHFKDNGKGIQSLTHKKKKMSGMGLINIRERAAFLGGSLTFHSQPGSGTEIIVQIPVSYGENK